MDSPLTFLETQTVALLMSSEPPNIIAELLGRPIPVIESAIGELSRPGRRSLAFLKQKEELDLVNEKNRRIQDKTLARRKKVQMPPAMNKSQKFQTKQVDYSKMVLVKIDHKTCVFIKPGQSIKEAKRKFIERHKPMTQLGKTA